MKFPLIQNIQDVLPHIEGKPEFVVAERDGFTVINYMVAFDTTFPNLPQEPTKMGVMMQTEYEREYLHASMLRECRGLMFDRDGKLISRPMQKFFNMNERIETLADNYDLTGHDYVVLEKLDGSFIRPVRIDGIIRLCTKMGITEQSHQAEEFLEGMEDDELHQKYFEFFESFVDDYTPVFEFCSRKNQIVIDYPEDRLVLLSMRHNLTGAYIGYRYLTSIAKAFGIPLVQPLFQVGDENPDTDPYTAEALVERIRPLIGVEGAVLSFDDGRKVKIKAEDYCVKHGAKDGLLLEKNVLATFLNEKLDDVLPLLDDAFKARVEAYTATVADGIQFTVFDAEQVVRFIKKHYETRKEQAIFIKDNIRPFSQSLMFAGLDGKDIRKAVIDKILSNTRTQTEVDSIREFIGNPTWA
jgi:RNA ligase